VRYFLDTEFNEFGGDLISLALISEAGDRELYVATDCDKPGAWVKENVIPILGAGDTHPIMIQPDDFGKAIAWFLADDKLPTIIADWPDDIRYFCQAVITGPGQMVNIPRLQFQMLRIDAYPTELPGAVQHNALWDARALRHVFMPQINAAVGTGKEP
jgi:hypothetical protein